MCLKCDGYSDEQIARGVELLIATHGWMVQGVQGNDGEKSDFAYTVGATESFGLPELVIMDTPAAVAQSILNWAVEMLRDGCGLDDLVREGVGWQPVHHAHLDSGIFGSYTRHYGHAPEDGWVVQLVPVHMSTSTDLSDPYVEL